MSSSTRMSTLHQTNLLYGFCEQCSILIGAIRVLVLCSCMNFIEIGKTMSKFYYMQKVFSQLIFKAMINHLSIFMNFRYPNSLLIIREVTRKNQCSYEHEELFIRITTKVITKVIMKACQLNIQRQYKFEMKIRYKPMAIE